MIRRMLIIKICNNSRKNQFKGFVVPDKFTTLSGKHYGVKQTTCEYLLYYTVGKFGKQARKRVFRAAPVDVQRPANSVRLRCPEYLGLLRQQTIPTESQVYQSRRHAQHVLGSSKVLLSVSKRVFYNNFCYYFVPA